MKSYKVNSESELEHSFGFKDHRSEVRTILDMVEQTETSVAGVLRFHYDSTRRETTYAEHLSLLLSRPGAHLVNPTKESN